MILRRILFWGFVILLIAIGFEWMNETWRGKPFVEQAVEDKTRSNRLELVQVPVGFNLFGRQGFDFEALVWNTNSGTGWTKRLEITRKDFEAGSPHRRWVNAIHSIDGSAGTAIIKVGEGNAPEGSGTINYLYSWREWNLWTNGEVRMFRIVVNPFEEFEPSKLISK
jgi:hypothetical protein